MQIEEEFIIKESKREEVILLTRELIQVLPADWCELNIRMSTHYYSWQVISGVKDSFQTCSLRTQTYSGCRLSPPKINVCEPEPGNDFCDVGILSQSQFSSSSPRTTNRGIRCEHLSFILSWNLIGQGETKVIKSPKSFPGSGSQTLFSAETSDSRKYVCVRRLPNTRLDENKGYFWSITWCCHDTFP